MSEEIDWPMGGTKTECRLWGTEAKEYVSNRSGYKVIFSPRAGGWYSIEGSLYLFQKKENYSRQTDLQSRLLHPDEIAKIVLSAHIWRHSHDHWRMHKSFSGHEDMPLINSEIKREAETSPIHDLSRRIENFMLCLYDLTQRRLGNESSYNALMIGQLQAASCCYDKNEFSFLFNDIIRENLDYADSTDHAIYPTPKGYQFLEKVLRPTIVSDQVFVAMWFDKQMDGVRKAIIKGIERAGYKAVFIDNKQFNGGITDEIIAEIRRSRFVVADFTSDPPEQVRGGVYYEAGFASGLGREVIHMCREDCMDEIHFDTSHINHIAWKKGKYKKLTDDLANRISATIGDGPSKKRSD